MKRLRALYPGLLSVPALCLGLVLMGCPAPVTPPPVVKDTTPPVAKSPSMYVYGIVGQPVTFDASLSTDDEGGELTYLWDFGDTTVSSSKTAVHTYTAEGVYTVKLTVTDGAGNKASLELLAVIEEPGIEFPTAVIDTDSVVIVTTAGTGVEFDGSRSVNASGSAAGLTYAWDFGDGTTGTGSVETHSYASGGTYFVKLTVTDASENTDSALVGVVVEELPTAHVRVNGTVVSGLTVKSGVSVTFDGSLSGDTDGTIEMYVWSVNGQRKLSGAEADTCSHNFTVGGTSTVTLEVTDDDAHTDSVSVTVTVENRPPVAEAGANLYVEQDMEFTLSGSGSDPDGLIASYAWSVTDAGGTVVALASEQNPALTLTQLGQYTATLTVTDNSGAQAADSCMVIVASLTEPDGQNPQSLMLEPEIDPELQEAVDNEPVSRSFLVPGTGLTIYALEDRPVSFDLSGSYDPGGLQTGLDPNAKLRYDWNFGDGSSVVSGDASGRKSHIYTAPGTYNLSVTVTDDEDSTAVVTITIKVLLRPNKAPAANAGPNVVETMTVDPVTLEGDPISVTFDGSASTDVDDTVLSYDWDFGDGSAHGSGANPVHEYASPGMYLVTLTVTDDGKGGVFAKKSGTDTMAVIIRREVLNYLPTADAGSDLAAFVGETVAFDGNDSFDAGGSIVSYAWSVSDESGTVATGTGVRMTHVFTQAGTYTATLTVTDNNGATAVDTATVTVKNQPPTAFRFTVTYEDTGPFDRDHPIIIALYDTSSDTWLDDGPVARKVITEDGTCLIQSGSLSPAYDPVNGAYAALLAHDVNGTGSAESNYWGLCDTTADGGFSTDLDAHESLKLGTEYRIEFRDVKASFEIGVF